jgi:hypothetical protein
MRFERFGSFRQQLEKAAEKARETVTTLANNLEQTVKRSAVCAHAPAAEPAPRRRPTQTQRRRAHPPVQPQAAPQRPASSQRCVQATRSANPRFSQLGLTLRCQGFIRLPISSAKKLRFYDKAGARALLPHALCAPPNAPRRPIALFRAHGAHPAAPV